jgi:hypothetical protein
MLSAHQGLIIPINAKGRLVEASFFVWLNSIYATFFFSLSPEFTS